MSDRSDVINMAVFCDFENIALGVRDAEYEKFDINRVLERLLAEHSDPALTQRWCRPVFNYQ